MNRMPMPHEVIANHSAIHHFANCLSLITPVNLAE
jgi:hypothetical protein